MIPVCLVFLIISCANKSSHLDQALKEQVLYYNNGAEPASLDPALVSDMSSFNVLINLYEGLVSHSPEDGKPIPGVARSWDISDDGLTYTFNLRKNAKWSNGDPVTAHDFVYGWKRELTPKLAAEYSFMLHYIKNAKAYNAGKITDFNQVGVKAMSDHKLVVTLENPTPFFLGLLQHQSACPVHQKTVEKYGKMDDRNNPWSKVENVVTNGAFLLTEWRSQDRLILEKNPLYWDAKNVRLNKAYFYTVDSQLTEERLFRSGQIHGTNRLLASKIKTYRENSPEFLRIDPEIANYYFDLNNTKPPFNNKLVRKAFAMSIDREAIVKYVTKGGEKPTGTFTPFNMTGYKNPVEIPYNVAQAKKYLAEAGYPEGKGFPKVELIYNTSENHKAIAETVQQMWKKNLGVHVGLANQDWKVFIKTRESRSYDIARDGWTGDYNDPNTFLEINMTGNAQNNSGYTNKDYDALIVQANKTRDQKKRMALFKKAEEILLEDAAVVPVFEFTNAYLLHTDVKGWHANLLSAHPLKYVYLERK